MGNILNNEIKVNKCVIGETYYLDGGWYSHNYITCKHKPLINTPVKFIGKFNKGFKNNTGKHIFQMPNGETIEAYATNTMLLEPIENPEILESDANIKYKELYG